jgi:hypothetical protein
MKWILPAHHLVLVLSDIHRAMTQLYIQEDQELQSLPKDSEATPFVIETFRIHEDPSFILILSVLIHWVDNVPVVHCPSSTLETWFAHLIMNLVHTDQCRIKNTIHYKDPIIACQVQYRLQEFIQYCAVHHILQTL